MYNNLSIYMKPTDVASALTSIFVVDPGNLPLLQHRCWRCQSPSHEFSWVFVHLISPSLFLPVFINNPTLFGKVCTNELTTCTIIPLYLHWSAKNNILWGYSKDSVKESQNKHLITMRRVQGHPFAIPHKDLHSTVFKFTKSTCILSGRINVCKYVIQMFTLCNANPMRSSIDVNWLNTIPLAPESFCSIIIISSFCKHHLHTSEFLHECYLFKHSILWTAE